MKRWMVCLGLLWGTSTFAGGTGGLEELVGDLIKENKRLFDGLRGGFEFADSVYAETKLGPHTVFPGQYLGPYVWQVKPKGATGEWSHTVTVFTETVVLDEKGRKLPKWEKEGQLVAPVLDERARKITEWIVKVEIQKIVP